MSDILTGTSSNVTTPLTATVTAIADNGSGKWRVTTSTPHFFGNGDYVELQVTISAVAKVVFGFIAVIDATHFDVPTLAFTATGTGTASDLSLTPQILVPTDGDPFSLQLSGMLSALQGILDRTQALRFMQVARTMTNANAFASGSVPIPPWATFMLVIGWGGGGGAGGGPGGFQGTPDHQMPAGSGGAGSRRVLQLLQIIGGPTSVDVVIGAGGTGGNGGAGGASPVSGSPAGDGGSTTVTWHDGSFAGTTFVTLLGGAGGGGGGPASGPVYAGSGSNTLVVFTPGARGPAGLFRSGPNGINSQVAPGYRQLQGLVNTAGAIAGPAAGWAGLFVDPVGQMDYQEGGASVANGNYSGYAAALSYAGAPSPEGLAGGSPGAVGTSSGPWPGAAGGGGGGAGGGGPGGAGGHGGNSSASVTSNGVAGTAGGANTGAGGGGGGGGGNGSSISGNGANGAAGGSGFCQIVWLGIQATP